MTVLALTLIGCSGGSKTDRSVDSDVPVPDDTADTDSDIGDDDDDDDGATASWTDGVDTVTLAVDDVSTLTRTYHFDTSHALRDDYVQQRTVEELSGQMVLRSGDLFFDGLFALAMQEVRENSVSTISDGAFSSPSDCECFETGEKWTYVWTRDTAYAVDLGLALIDPTRSKNSLAFKLSPLKASVGGGDTQIVQDTGSGGSWPISSDRVVWAIGARKVLAFLDGQERTDFRDAAYEALVNTIATDREVVFDDRDGLYRGEQSFLDWREQTYPMWTAGDVAHIGMSKALSTNIGHLVALELAADLADEKGLSTSFRADADALRAAIDEAFWLGDAYSTLKTTELDDAALRKQDWLGTALAVLELHNASRGSMAVASYPHAAGGPPVIWPQQPLIPIYHNRGVWPFVTAYGLKAAREAGNAAVVDAGMNSLVRGAALNLSNMENFEFTALANWYDDGVYSGPVVNSRRQLWSVAGYISMVVDTLFGMEVDGTGIRFHPFVTPGMRDIVGDEVTLHNVPFKGTTFDVTLQVGTDGSVVASDRAFEVAPGDQTIALVSASHDMALTEAIDNGDFRELWAPREPAIDSLTGGQLSFNDGGEAGVAIDVFRDGQLFAADASSPFAVSGNHCWSVASTFPTSGTVSHHAEPICDWQDVQSVFASSFSVTGGTFVNNYGREHYENWGETGHTLEVSFTPVVSGEHLVQAVYGNGAHAVNTGVTCAVKKVEVWDGTTLVDTGFLAMPHLGAWDIWDDSTFAPVTLQAGTAYTIRLVDAPNMSYREHFVAYTAAGGGSGVHNYVNIAEIKLLAR